MSKPTTLPTTLYVDGACKGNPGLGGWGVFIQHPDGHEEELFGGEAATTNNRMELSAAIEGIKQIAAQQPVVIWTDSSYVQKGMSEWLAGWKKRNWRKSDGSAVLNADLWQQLDSLSANRQIEWKWIKGHAGHAGNERADQLANKGADLAAVQLTEEKKNITAFDNPAAQQPTSSGTAKAVPSLDWLSSDPLGLGIEDPGIEGMVHEDSYQDTIDDAYSVVAEEASSILTEDTRPNVIPASQVSQPQPGQMHPAIKCTPATLDLKGKRQLILDTETTGFYFSDGDRIVEVGVIEMVNRKLTGSSFHVYINPQRLVGDSENIHGISDAFLADKPVFAEIVHALDAYLDQAEIIAHNATFDMNFLEAEFARAKLPPLKGRVQVTDTLIMAKRKHPGQKNSLDALVKRYEIKQRDRTFHGALLDAEILADVYLSMTGGQVTLDIGQEQQQTTASSQQDQQQPPQQYRLPVITASEEENQAHQDWLEQFEKKNGFAALWSS